jgi:hypothetical protein
MPAPSSWQPGLPRSPGRGSSTAQHLCDCLLRRMRATLGLSEVDGAAVRAVTSSGATIRQKVPLPECWIGAPHPPPARPPGPHPPPARPPGPHTRQTWHACLPRRAEPRAATAKTPLPAVQAPTSCQRWMPTCRCCRWRSTGRTWAACWASRYRQGPPASLPASPAHGGVGAARPQPPIVANTRALVGGQQHQQPSCAPR